MEQAGTATSSRGQIPWRMRHGHRSAGSRPEPKLLDGHELPIARQSSREVKAKRADVITPWMLHPESASGPMEWPDAGGQIRMTFTGVITTWSGADPSPGAGAGR